MQTNKTLVAAALIAISLVAVRNQTAATPTPPPVPQTWEHLAMEVPGEKLSTPEISGKIIKLGNDGWELVDVETIIRSGATKKMIYFFKRPKS